MHWNRNRVVLLTISCGLICVGSVHPTFGQGFRTVQLPTYQQFSMTTSLLVPDQGSVYAGGNHGSRSSRTRGLRTGSVVSSGVSVSAYVHDFEALDAAVTEQGRQAPLRKGKSLSLIPARIAAAGPARRPTIREVRARTQAKRMAEHDRARSDYELARRLAGKGKYAAARILLKSALSRADDSLRSTIVEQLATVDRAKR